MIINIAHTAVSARAVRALLAVIVGMSLSTKPSRAADLAADFQQPPAAARPWVFWYWMQASVSRAGITADLEAMKQAGIGGAYLMPIRGPADPPLFDPPIVQLSPRWWEMVRHAATEADRLGLKLAMHACDGFATASGPWITPELSMQKVVWATTHVAGGRRFDELLAEPQTNEDYYRDIAVLAYPSIDGAGISTRTIVPTVTTSKPNFDAQLLVDPDRPGRLRSEEPCWIQYAFDEPFTCRSITIHPDGNNYQSLRLSLQASDDGENFRPVDGLEPPRHGWQDTDAPVTYAIPPTTARYFRFMWDKAGSEPGAEDLDSAKWRPVLKIEGIQLSAEPRLHQFEGKTAAVWRIARRTTAEQIPAALCVQPDDIVDLTEHLAADGRLTWDVPEGRWTILRLGHTSTGHTNYIGGGGIGLECDKFNPQAVRRQFDRWFGEAIRQIGPDLAGRVLEIFHVDSWECGSQNWSPVFRDEFRRRRGYDLAPYLPAMAGIPVQSADVSERFLHDVRQTIAELVVDNFFGTLAELAHEHGCQFSAENVAPTMTSDGMLHFGAVDIPMGEFWLRSPTHDKLNDMLDAISGAHVYGKPVVQAEAFTQLRMAWDEHPALLKTLADRNYALGINRLVYHVFAHNPWLDRRPGMTLDAIGSYFQRDQTWWRPGRAWVQYAQRCQGMLQRGRHVADVAVFTGEQVPRRALLPDRLVPTLPGIFGPDVVQREEERLANHGQPTRELPDGVTHSANMADPEDWVDPLHGYAYDSINPDALLRLATVRDGRIVLPGGASYALLVVPGARRMAPDGKMMTPEVAECLRKLATAGATVLLVEPPTRSPSLTNYPDCDDEVRRTFSKLLDSGDRRLLLGPYREDSFAALGIARDLVATDSAGQPADNLAWTHRQAPEFDVYFISNQQQDQRTLQVSFHVAGRVPELWNPVTGQMRTANSWHVEQGRTILPLRLAPGGSIFVVFREPTTSPGRNEGSNWIEPRIVQRLEGPWQVTFAAELGGPEQPVTFDHLEDWTSHSEPGIRYYSGTATYQQSFDWRAPDGKQSPIWLDLGRVANLAEVTLNGVPCGVAWTPPYRVEITSALQPGENRLRVDVTNTWANRLIGDQALPEDERVTWTTAPFRLQDKPLLEAGLLGPVSITTE